MSKLLSGRYELIEKVGEGGMAVVYKAKDRLLSRYVAIKILRPEFVRDASFVDSFRKESQQAAALQHPNIISVYDVGQEGSIYYIVMELVTGRTLSDVIKAEAPMNYKEVIRISKQIVSALSLAHSNNIIHRDIKPHNIMITDDGTAKLGDFGIAKAVSDSTLTETSKVIGSVHYFSPEQARGSYVDERSDIYSLGIVMYEMLTGRVPFDGDNPVQVALMHINDDIIPPSQLVPGIPPQLEKIVMKATDKFQSNRYRSAQEMLDDLNNIDFVTNVVGNSVFASQEQKAPVNVQRDVQPQPEEYDDYQDYEKEKPKKNKKKGGNKKLAVTAAILAALCVIVGIFAVPRITESMNKVTVPDVTDMQYSKAKSTLKDKGFKVVKEEEHSDDVESGRVIKQDPEANSKEDKGTTITLTVSSGKDVAEVPNMVGKYYNENDTETILEDAGFKIGTVSQQASDDYKKGQIISQTPTGGAQKTKGSYVNLVVCSGPSTVKKKVPSLTGLTASEAETKLVKAGFKLGKVDYEESTVYGEGYVMWQQYTAGSKLKEGSTVDITISKGAPDDNNGGGDSDDDSSDGE
ncbi:MAG: Stk1 family PASTA domain-containing Ser/Thr kinase [Eubacteriales bacterium]|nr:Stk1 family PASTA domain-containing Ser/Thr kinase [Eubacteriales bacterium]